VPFQEKAEEAAMLSFSRGFIGLLGAAGALAGVLALAPAASAADMVKLRVSTITAIDTAPLEAAKAQGYFKDVGLDVDTTPMVGGAHGLPALAAGQVQIASSNIVSIILGAKQGLDFKIIVAGDVSGDHPPDLAGLVAKPGSTIKGGKDLEGKKLGVNTRNNIIWLYARAWVKATGGDPAKVTYLEVPFPQMVDAVQQGNVDAAFVVEPFLSAAAKAGRVKIVGWPYGDVQKEIPISEFVATGAYIKAHPDVIDRFVRAYNKGVDWVDAHEGKPEWFALISNYTHLAVDKVKELSPPRFPKTLRPDHIAAVVDLMHANGMMSGQFDPNSILYKSVLPAAAAAK
jgi:NitT/TauT family transport system substrate-binding protein